MAILNSTQTVAELGEIFGTQFENPMERFLDTAMAAQQLDWTGYYGSGYRIHAPTPEPDLRLVNFRKKVIERRCFVTRIPKGKSEDGDCYWRRSILADTAIWYFDLHSRIQPPSWWNLSVDWLERPQVSGPSADRSSFAEYWFLRDLSGRDESDRWWKSLNRGY